MSNIRSDTNENTAKSHKIAVREFLRTNGEVASEDQLRAGIEVPAWYIDQITSQDPLYTSLNHHESYVVNKHVVGHRQTHDGS